MYTSRVGKNATGKKKTLGAHCAPSARPFLPTGRIGSAVRAHVFWPKANLQSLTTTTQRMRSTQQFKGRFLSFSNTYTNKLAYLNRNNSNNNNYYNNIVNKGCALCLLFSRQDKKKTKRPKSSKNALKRNGSWRPWPKQWSGLCEKSQANNRKGERGTDRKDNATVSISGTKCTKTNAVLPKYCESLIFRTLIFYCEAVTMTEKQCVTETAVFRQKWPSCNSPCFEPACTVEKMRAVEFHAHFFHLWHFSHVKAVC